MISQFVDRENTKIHTIVITMQNNKEINPKGLT